MELNKKNTLIAALACVVWSTSTMAATEQQKLDAINKGLANLASAQIIPGGYWNYGGYEQAATGAAVLAFTSQKDKWGAKAAQYQATVDNAMSYLLSTATTTTVGVRTDGFNPCGTGTCTGVYWYGAGETTYTTGLVAPAIATYAVSKGANTVATTSGPLAGLTWSQIAQGITNTFAASQTTAAAGNLRGGWRYYPGEQDSDGSTTQWAVIAMIYDQTLGATTPQFVKDELKYWLAADQDSVSGAGCYQFSTTWCDHSDTGSLLLGQKFVGYDLNNQPVKSALGFLNTNWSQLANGTWFGNFGHPYAMWAVYKGLETNIGLNDTTHIVNLLTTCGAPNNLPGNPPGSVPCNWWEDYNEALVTSQNVDGSWTGYQYWYGPLATAFNVNILGATTIPVGNGVLDDFNRPNGSVGTNWSGAINKKQYAIENGQVEPDGWLPIYWNKNRFGVNQEAFVTLKTVDPKGMENDLLLKVQANSKGVPNYMKGYIEVWFDPKAKAIRVDTLLPNKPSKIYTPDISVTFKDGDRFGAKVYGSGPEAGTVHIYQNETEVGKVTLDSADQAFFNPRGGNIGLWFIDTRDAYFDDFGGGNL